MDDTPYRQNPVLTRGPHTASSSDPDDRKKRFAAVLLPCLALVAPMSMNEEDRKLWLKAAYVALGDIPLDLLQLGAKAAMATATHPSKIVPTILEHVAEQARWRKEPRQSQLPPALPSNKGGPLSREMLDRMQKGGNELLSAIRDLGLAGGYIYWGEDGRLHEAFEKREAA